MRRRFKFRPCNMPSKLFPRNEVWAASIAAQRINGEYVKAGAGAYSTADGNKTKVTNMALIRILLENPQDIIPEDYEKGEQIRLHFCAQIYQLITGEASDFTKNVLDIASKDEIDIASGDIPLIACLPSVYKREREQYERKEQLKTLSANSSPLQQSFGGHFQGTVNIVNCYYNKKFECYAVNALNESTNQLVFFFFRRSLPMGAVLQIKGRVKAYRGNTTQLNFVKEVKVNDNKEVVH